MEGKMGMIDFKASYPLGSFVELRKPNTNEGMWFKVITVTEGGFVELRFSSVEQRMEE